MFEGMLYAEKSRVAQEIVGISRADWAVSFAPGCYLQLYPYSFYFYLHMYVGRYVCMHACM